MNNFYCEFCGCSFFKQYILYLTKNNINSKIYSTLISSILAFALIAGIPTAFENISA
jgi:hypothetical protein